MSTEILDSPVSEPKTYQEVLDTNPDMPESLRKHAERLMQQESADIGDIAVSQEIVEPSEKRILEAEPMFVPYEPFKTNEFNLSPEQQATVIESRSRIIRDLYIQPDTDRYGKYLEAVDGMLASGLEEEAIKKVFGSGESLTEFIDMPPGSEEVNLKNTVNTFLRYSTKQTTIPSGFIEKIKNKPEYFALIAGAIESGAQQAIDAGYPKDKIYQSFNKLYVFSGYDVVSNEAQQLPPSTELMGPDFFNQREATYIKKNLEAMQLVGGTTSKYLELIGRENDSFVASISLDLRANKEVDIMEIKSTLDSASEKLLEKQASNPKLFRAMAESSFIAKGNMKEIEQAILNMEELDNRKTLFEDFPSLYYSKEFADDDVNFRYKAVIWTLESIQADNDLTPSENNEALKGVMICLDDMQKLMDSGILDKIPIDFSAARQAYLPISNYDLDQKHVNNELLNKIILSDLIKDRLNNDSFGRQIRSSFDVMSAYIGDFNIDNAVSLLETVGYTDNEPEFLSRIIRAEARLGGSDKSRGAKYFYEIAGSVLTKKDKDGNPYDSIDFIDKVFIPLNGEFADQYQEQLDWYRKSELPLTCCPQILIYRSQALEAGIEDNPVQIYDWINKNEKIRGELSHQYAKQFLTGEITAKRPGFFDLGGELDKYDSQEAELLIQEFSRDSKERQESFRLLLNLDSDELSRIIDDGGRIRSILDSSIPEEYSRGSTYTQKRSGIEIALGIRSLNEDEAHPIYGTCGFIDRGMPGGAEGYGNIMLVFKPDQDLLDRTSFTPADSFHGPFRLTAEDAMTIRSIKSGEGMGFGTTREYVEAQIRGAINLSNVESIVVPTEEIAATVREMLPEILRNSVIVRGETEEYDSSIEKNTYELFKKANPPK